MMKYDQIRNITCVVVLLFYANLYDDEIVQATYKNKVG